LHHKLLADSVQPAVIALAKEFHGDVPRALLGYLAGTLEYGPKLSRRAIVGVDAVRDPRLIDDVSLTAVSQYDW